MPRSVINLSVIGLTGAIRFFETLRRDDLRIKIRVLARSNRDIQRLFVRHLKNEIGKATTRRTGNLLKVQTKGFRRGPQLTIKPLFPRTAYHTPFGRGRPGASKVGQYAFVTNHNRRFIQAAVNATLNDPELNRIFLKHYDFIIEDIRRKTTLT